MLTLEKIPRTTAELFRMLPEGLHVELVENQILMPPSPVEIHQDTTGDLFAELRAHVKRHQLGKVYVAPFDVYLDTDNAFQPDIIFIGKERLHIVHDYVEGAPDMVVEILSPGTRHLDLGVKKDVYERNGVKEYVVVDPATKEVQVFALTNGKYTVAFEGKGEVKSALLSHTFVV